MSRIMALYKAGPSYLTLLCCPHLIYLYPHNNYQSETLGAHIFSIFSPITINGGPNGVSISSNPTFDNIKIWVDYLTKSTSALAVVSLQTAWRFRPCHPRALPPMTLDNHRQGPQHSFSFPFHKSYSGSSSPGPPLRTPYD